MTTGLNTPTARPDLSERAYLLTVPFQATVKSLSVERPINVGTAQVGGRHDLSHLSLRVTGSHATKCPLWVKSRHFGLGQGCPLYPQERTLLDTPLSSSEPVRSGSAQVWGLATVRLANPVGSRKFGEVVLSCGRVE